MKRWVIGADLGGTLIRAMRTDLEGRMLARAEAKTQAQQGPEAILGRIFEVIGQASGGTDPGEVLGIAIGAPGPVDEQGRLFDPPNLPGLREISLRERIQDRFQLPTFAGNDGNLGALG